MSLRAGENAKWQCSCQSLMSFWTLVWSNVIVYPMTAYNSFSLPKMFCSLMPIPTLVWQNTVKTARNWLFFKSLYSPSRRMVEHETVFYSTQGTYHQILGIPTRKNLSLRLVTNVHLTIPYWFSRDSFRLPFAILWQMRVMKCSIMWSEESTISLAYVYPHQHTTYLTL